MGGEDLRPPSLSPFPGSLGADGGLSARDGDNRPVRRESPAEGLWWPPQGRWGRPLQRIIDTIGPAQADEPVTVALAEHEAGVRGAAEARGAGDHVHGGAIIELPQMMYQQHGNAVPVRQPFERTDVPVVVGVGTHIIVHGADALQSVDDYLTNIEESPGGIAAQWLRDFAIIQKFESRG